MMSGLPPLYRDSTVPGAPSRNHTCDLNSTCPKVNCTKTFPHLCLGMSLFQGIMPCGCPGPKRERHPTPLSHPASLLGVNCQVLLIPSHHLFSNLPPSLWNRSRSSGLIGPPGIAAIVPRLRWVSVLYSAPCCQHDAARVRISECQC